MPFIITDPCIETKDTAQEIRIVTKLSVDLVSSECGTQQFRVA